MCVGCLCGVRLLLMRHACAVDRHVMAACDFVIHICFVWMGRCSTRHLHFS